MKNYLIILLTLFVFKTIIAQVPVPAKDQTGGAILLLNGKAHLGNGKVIEKSAIAFQDGKLTLVADATLIKLDKAAFDTIISIKGKHVYPGFIAPNSTLGLVEIGAVRATKDFAEVGIMNPNVRSIIAYNTDSKITPTVRSNGILLAQITPRGGRVSGTSSVVELDGWNWEDAVYKIDDGIHLNWPKKNTRTWGWDGPGDAKKNKRYQKELSRLVKFFDDARAYAASAPVEKNLRFEAMRGLYDGAKNLYVHVNSANGILKAIGMSKDAGIKDIVIVGGEESYKVTDVLKENNISVMINRIHSLPRRSYDDIDLPYKLPAILYKAGILYCLENSGDMEAMGTRNLPFYAGTPIAYGLPPEEGVKAITLNTAKILGIDGTVGSLEVGKDATLIVSTGDALDVMSNNIEQAFVRGKNIDLDNHQKALYRKFRGKYQVENKQPE